MTRSEQIAALFDALPIAAADTYDQHRRRVEFTLERLDAAGLTIAPRDDPPIAGTWEVQGDDMTREQFESIRNELRTLQPAAQYVTVKGITLRWKPVEVAPRDDLGAAWAAAEAALPEGAFLVLSDDPRYSAEATTLAKSAQGGHVVIFHEEAEADTPAAALLALAAALTERGEK